jgi:hemolysin activation/secretion protein
LLLLKDLPGVDVESTLRPGNEVGTSHLEVSVADAAHLHYGAELDNFGSSYTGKERVGAHFELRNLGGKGDQLTARAIKSSGMDYAQLSVQVPLGGQGFRLGATWAGLQYQLGKDFASLQAHGKANSTNFWLIYPLIRSQQQSWYLQVVHDNKRLQDSVDTRNSVIDKNPQASSITVLGNFADEMSGVTQANLTFTSGRLKLDSVSTASDQAATGLGTSGGYDKLFYSVSRNQQLSPSWSMLGRLTGQVAGKNLDASEKFLLGGVQGVRAYTAGDAAGDDAWLATIELQYALAEMPQMQVLIFHDTGKSKASHHPMTQDAALTNSQRLSGTGLGVNWNRGKSLTMKASLAWQSGDAPVSGTSPHPRGWLQLIHSY